MVWVFTLQYVVCFRNVLLVNVVDLFGRLLVVTLLDLFWLGLLVRFALLISACLLFYIVWVDLLIVYWFSRFIVYWFGLILFVFVAYFVLELRLLFGVSGCIVVFRNFVCVVVYVCQICLFCVFVIWDFCCVQIVVCVGGWRVLMFVC